MSRTRRLVIDRLGRHRPHQGQIIRDPGHVRNKLAQHNPGLTMRPEPKRRSQQLPRLLVKMDLERARISLAMMLREHRLGIEQVHLAGSAMLKQADHRPRSPLRPGTPVRIRRILDNSLGSTNCQPIPLVKQVGQRKCSKRPGISAQEAAAIE